MYVRIDPKINIDPARIAMKIRKAAEKSLPEVTAQILADTSQYVPRRAGNLGGTLERSASLPQFLEPTKSELRWSTVYANYVYKGLSKQGKPLKYNKDPHAEAGAEWCKRAKRLHLMEWQKMAEKLIKKEYKNG